MSCPLSQLPDGGHLWDKYNPEGKLKNRWKCFWCGRTRRIRRTSQRYRTSLAKGRTK